MRVYPPNPIIRAAPKRPPEWDAADRPGLGYSDVRSSNRCLRPSRPCHATPTSTTFSNASPVRLVAVTGETTCSPGDAIIEEKGGSGKHLSFHPTPTNTKRQRQPHDTHRGSLGPAVGGQFSRSSATNHACPGQNPYILAATAPPTHYIPYLDSGSLAEAEAAHIA